MAHIQLWVSDVEAAAARKELCIGSDGADKVFRLWAETQLYDLKQQDEQKRIAALLEELGT